MSEVAAFLKRSRKRHLDELQEFLRIPSVSMDPSRGPDMRRAAEWVRGRLEAAGCSMVEVVPTAGQPIVYGEWLGARGKPTILVYGHYDVQPEDPLDQWKSPPFEPSIRDEKIYARGASDDKGQLIVHVNALEAHLKEHGSCPVNVKFLIEGEEEIGSAHLDDFLRRRKRELACDAVVVSDTAMFAKGIPSICYGLRGITYLELHVRGTNGDLHSGTFGGSVVNPANALVEMLASLKDAKGRVRIPGFYANVRRLTAAERRAFAALPHSDRKFQRAIGAPRLFGEAGYTTLERIWARPTLDVNGIWGGFSGEGAKTVLPAEAHAKISMRLVPDQTHREIARKATAYLRKLAPKSVRLEVREIHGGEAWLADLEHPALKAAGEALRRAFGRRPVFVREGGSIPIVPTFAKQLRAPAVLMGFGLNDDNLHAPNEKLDLDNFYRGIEASAYLMEELGRSAAARKTPRSGGRGRTRPKRTARRR